MGDFAEDMLDRELERAMLGPRRRGGILFRFGPGFYDTETWTMKDGATIKLVDMSARHRGNVIRMLERRVRGLPGVDAYGLHHTPLIQKMKELGIE